MRLLADVKAKVTCCAECGARHSMRTADGQSTGSRERRAAGLRVGEEESRPRTSRGVRQLIVEGEGGRAAAATMTRET